jgi:hypothetical protein
MKRLKTGIGVVALALALGACGSDADDADDPNASTINNTTANNSTTNNATTNNSTNGTTVSSTPNVAANNMATGGVRVACVSDLVTTNGNYYAVLAEITAGQARVELINYLAATPTSDPVEESIWNEQVAAQFSPVVFAYQTNEHFLDVSKTADETMYRGTMSGTSQFGDSVNATCWPVDIEYPANYASDSGTCVDSEGNRATNDIPWMVALRTGFGQCVSFEGELAGQTTSATFDFIDLRGADLSGATLRSTTVQDVQLEGADLSGITLESASISGTKDAFTVLPEAGCDDQGDTFTCAN